MVPIEGFFMLLFRIDSPEDFRGIVFFDFLIGPICGLLMFLWFNKIFRIKIARSAIVPYISTAIVISAFYMFWHFYQVMARGEGHPLQMLMRLECQPSNLP
jgi:hypothetical protein